MRSGISSSEVIHRGKPDRTRCDQRKTGLASATKEGYLTRRIHVPLLAPVRRAATACRSVMSGTSMRFTPIPENDYHTPAHIFDSRRVILAPLVLSELQLRVLFPK